MKIQKNIILAIVATSVMVLFLGGLFFYEFCKVFSEHSKSMRLPARGTVARELYSKAWEKSARESNQLHDAIKLEKAGEYDSAIKAYLQIIESITSNGYKNMARQGLINCYEKTGQYDAAIKEIDWLLERKVLATPELLERKRRIQELKQ